MAGGYLSIIREVTDVEEIFFNAHKQGRGPLESELLEPKVPGAGNLDLIVKVQALLAFGNTPISGRSNL